MSWPEGVAPRHVETPDGVPIGVFTSGTGPPLILVHGTAGDHTTFRVVGPLLAARRTVHAIDRRGRGASGDGPSYSIEREFEDVAAVADAIREDTGDAVEVVGHSFGGRTALGAALRTDAIGSVVCYEGAPPPAGASYQPDGLEVELRRLLEAGEADELYATFLTEVVGMPVAELAAYRLDPVWPVRVATASTIVRELAAERTPAAGLDALGSVRQPVLQLLGGESLPVFAQATAALDARLPAGWVTVIDGARHGAHHTHPEAFVAAVLGEPPRPTAPMRD